MLPVSVIIPVYNRAVVVRDSIESVFLQKTVDEIIVVDDCSTDDIYRFLKPYLSRIHYYKLDKNLGVSTARNFGINSARNSFIAFLDSDDIFLPHKIEKQYSFMLHHGYKISHTDELWLRDDKWINQGKSNTRYGDDIFTKVLDKCRVSPSSLMIDRDVFEKVGLFDEALRVCEDYEFILRASIYFNVGYLQENLIVKRAFLDNQLSKRIQYIESIRLEILERFYNNFNKEFSKERLEAVEKELKRKQKIVKKVEGL